LRRTMWTRRAALELAPPRALHSWRSPSRMMRACACHRALLPRLLGAALGVHRVPPTRTQRL
jgi:hypothetical protein